MQKTELGAATPAVPRDQPPRRYGTLPEAVIDALKLARTGPGRWVGACLACESTDAAMVAALDDTGLHLDCPHCRDDVALGRFTWRLLGMAAADRRRRGAR